MTRTGRRPTGLLILAALAAVSVFALAGGAAAESSESASRWPENLVEIKVADRAAVEQLMADAESVGAEFNDHYLRQNEDDGTVTVQVLGDDDQIAALRDMGYEILGTIEDEEAYWDRIAERLRAIEAEQAGRSVAETGISPDLNRFGLRAGVAATVDRGDHDQPRRLLPELRRPVPLGRGVQRDHGPADGRRPDRRLGPTLAVTWDAGPGTEIGSGGPRTHVARTSTRPAPRTPTSTTGCSIRLGAPNTNTPPRPSRVRIASSSGAIRRGGRQHVDRARACRRTRRGFLRGFHNRYMDPTEIYQRFEQLAAEFAGPAASPS